MRYLLALLLPPVAVFLCGKPIQGLINIILTLCFYVPGAIHALLVVHSYLADKRTDKIVDAIKHQDDL
ncbi:YqaE/Pmp3 family membrane protein [Pseudomonadales bacterium]|nr:YqaE/Pmp3 family membrane protein [Pseudomonadales bacterium]MDB9868116.1 YqaE/Pmp3 family membrane protein [Pseudomonadales bacterium]|tara:strand:+ start:279 stop:482 length:204 start_codon:yes stop_codon:yes gene_type:complete